MLHINNITKISVIVLFTSILSCSDILSEKRKNAEFIIEKVEKFKTKNNRLPNNIQEIGLEEKTSNLSFYSKISSDEYEVWYGTVLGVSNVYNSKTKTWQEKG